MEILAAIGAVVSAAVLCASKLATGATADCYAGSHALYFTERIRGLWHGRFIQPDCVRQALVAGLASGIDYDRADAAHRGG